MINFQNIKHCANSLNIIKYKMEPERSAAKVIKLKQNVIVFPHEQLVVFDREDFVLDRRSHHDRQVSAIIFSADIHNESIRPHISCHEVDLLYRSFNLLYLRKQ